MVRSSLAPKWSKSAPFCGRDHQKSKLLLISGTLSFGGCWGQPMVLFWKLVDETQISTPPKATRHHNSTKYWFFYPSEPFSYDHFKMIHPVLRNVVMIFIYGKRFRYAPSFNNVNCISFYWYRLDQLQKCYEMWKNVFYFFALDIFSIGFSAAEGSLFLLKINNQEKMCRRDIRVRSATTKDLECAHLCVQT